MQPEQLLAAQTPSASCGTDSGAEEALIRIDIAYAMQQLLVQKRSFDAGLSPAEEGGEVLGGNGKRFPAGTGKGVILPGFQPSEATCIHEPQLTAGAEPQNGVCVFWNGGDGVADQQTSGHAQMHDPLRLLRQVENDVLADTIYAINLLPRQQADHSGRFGLEWFRHGTEPGRLNYIPAHTLMHTAGDRFDFGKFRHRTSVSIFSGRRQRARVSATLNRFLCLKLFH